MELSRPIFVAARDLPFFRHANSFGGEIVPYQRITHSPWKNFPSSALSPMHQILRVPWETGGCDSELLPLSTLILTVEGIDLVVCNNCRRYMASRHFSLSFQKMSTSMCR
jgi:hypothetical protein